ncbi:MAG: hypothetical protein ACYSSI_06535 [Planctomycetota bacterium]|jgi:hypothetical protein
MSEEQKNNEKPKPRTSILAVGSIIVVLFGFFLLPWFLPIGLAGILLSAFALWKIRKSNRLLRGTVWAITGIVLSTIYFFAALMLCVVRPLAQKMLCDTSISGLGRAMMLYSSDYNDRYPTPDKWCDLLKESGYTPEKYFVCLAHHREQRCSYAINPDCQPNSPNDVVLLFETKGGWNKFGGVELISADNHKGKGAMVVFNNGYVEFVKPKDFNDLKWKADVNQ